MMFSKYLKPALAAFFFAALGVGWYWFETRSRPEEKETPSNALVIVVKSTNACFSDMVRVTGFIVPRREAVVGADQERRRKAIGSDIVARAGCRPRHRGQDHRRRAGLATGRADVSHFRQQ